MAFSTTVNKALYVGNGATVNFAAPFLFYDQTHLQVSLVDRTTGLITTQALTTNYTVSGVGLVTGGTVTFLVAPPNTVNVLIVRLVPETQGVDLKEGDKFPPDTIEQALDLLTMMVQQLDEISSRSVKLPAGTALSGVTVPDINLTVNRSKGIKVTSDGTGFETFDLSTNPFTSPLTTKGDIPVHDGVAAARLPVGADGGLLMAKSAQTLGVAYLAPGTDGQVLKSDSSNANKITWANPVAFDGARGLKVVPHVPGSLGTYVNSTTAFATQSGSFNLFDGTVNDGHIIGSLAQFSAVNYLISTAASPTTVVYEYWNGASWANLSGVSAPSFNAIGFSQLRFTVPGDWAVGGSGTGTPSTTFNIRVRQTSGTTTVAGSISLANRVDITADEVIASAGIAKVVTQSLGTITPDIRVAGPIANGRDQAGAFSANTFIYLWLIFNPTSSTWAGLWSASATAPVLPTGYTFKVRVSALRLDSNILLPPWFQLGREVTYTTGFSDAGPNNPTVSTAFTVTVPPIAIASKHNITVAANGQMSFSPYPLGSAYGNVASTIPGGPTQIGPLLVPLAIAQTLYYVTNAVNATIVTNGFTMPGNLS